ncbi:MAG TPA: phosphate ABC transporter permease subunit PstC [Rhodocyclaceae bacterium]|nr:phosphate ABC transporter permease subunit PstC [Rhodocyclaceae bacterium]
MRAVTALAAHLSGLLLAGVVLFVLWQAWPALEAVGPLRFVTDGAWLPDGRPAQFGLLPMLLASVAVTVGAMLLAGPLGLATAVFMTDYAPAWLARLLRGVVELLAGVPSVIYGLWGLVTLVPLLAAWQPPGASLLAGMLVLALMILPTMTLTAHAAITSVGSECRLAVAALGFTGAGALWGVVLPAARNGLCGALLLSTARALGETMVVLMVMGNVVRLPDGLLAPARTLTANIALELGYAGDRHRAALFVGGLVLTGLVAALVLAARRMGCAVRHA